MYVCQQCSRISNPGESANFVVTKTRQKTYSDNGQITYNMCNDGWKCHCVSRL